ncbi:MAG: PHB depolymerase family esterase [Acidimicrobiia bacterium]
MRTVDGRTRTYRVHVPPRIDSSALVPVVLALHGGVGSGAQFERNSGFDALADRNRFVVVYPDGIPIGGASVFARGRVWNGGKCCGPAATGDVDDVTFLTRVIDSVRGRFHGDPRRVFVTGHSNGAIMAYRLACERADRIAAIGVQAGTLEIPTCSPSRPVSVLHIHGTADRNIPIGGGRGIGMSGTDFFPPQQAVEILAGADRCPARPTVRVDAENSDVSTRTWSPCGQGTAVEFVTVTGAPHAWMGHPSSTVASPAGSRHEGYDSSAAIWTFFAAHGR